MPSDHHPSVAGVVIWLAACGGAALLIATPARPGRAAAASLGLATGLLSDGDVSAQLVGYGGLERVPSRPSSGRQQQARI